MPATAPEVIEQIEESIEKAEQDDADQVVERVQSSAKQVAEKLAEKLMGKRSETAKQVVAATMPEHRRCPICWHGQRGHGNTYQVRGRTRYYKCCRCGFTWKAVVEITIVDETDGQP